MASTFLDLRHELFRCYGERRFEDALELVRSRLDDHPAERPRMTFWLACLECKLGRRSDALETLESYLAEGGWLSPLHLKNDGDLDVLRGDPAFERIVAACDERLAKEQELIEPRLLVEQPSNGTSSRALLVALHMMGGTAEESIWHWRSVTDLGIKLAAPSGTELVGPNAYAWGEGTATELRRHLETLGRDQPGDTDRLVLAGASQGARMAVLLAMDGSVAAEGFIAVVGAPPHEQLAEHLKRAGEAGLRGVFITGEHDAAREGIEKTHRWLEDRGLQVRLKVVPALGHDYPPGFQDLLRDSLDFILNDGETNG